MFKYFDIYDFDLSKKVVGMRVDLNSPIKNGKIVNNPRIEAHSKSIKKIVSMGAKLVVLAHQGKVGSSNCVSLEEHRLLIERRTGLKGKLMTFISLPKVRKEIKNLKKNEFIILENVRFLKDEFKPRVKKNKIRNLEKLFNYYILDAFSVCHREQASIIGFNGIINIVGPVFKEELNNLRELHHFHKPVTYILAGNKIKELLDLIEANIDKKHVDNFLLCGIIGEIFSHLKGKYLGRKVNYFIKKGYLKYFDRIKKLLEKNPKKFFCPQDFAVKSMNKRLEIALTSEPKNKKILDKRIIKDIGEKTILNYCEIISKSKTIFMKGTPGDFENHFFNKGTKRIIEAIEKTNPYICFGGGHTSLAVSKYFVNKKKINYMSLSGGALLEFLSHRKLFGTESVKNSYIRNKSLLNTFTSFGSNTVDIEMQTQFSITHIKAGSKIRIQDDFKTTYGGGGINIAQCLNNLGADTSYFGKFSKEEFTKLKKFLKSKNIRIVKTKATKQPQSKSIILNTEEKDRIIFAYKGHNNFLLKNDVELEDIQDKNFVFTMNTGKTFDTMLYLIEKIKTLNNSKKICFLLSYYGLKDVKTRLKNILKFTDVIILNKEEAISFTGVRKIKECLKILQSYNKKIVIITDGPNGAYCYDGEKEYFEKAFNKLKIIDTTGAGDCFSATFFYYYIQKESIQNCLKYATINSASIVQFKGATSKLLSDYQIKNRYEEHYT